MASYNKRISDQSKVKFNPINRELEDSENSEIDSRVDNLEENILGSKTATGNPITVTDAAPVNAVNLSIDLEPIQSGSGTPSPENIRPINGRSEVAIGRVSNNVWNEEWEVGVFSTQTGLPSSNIDAIRTKNLINVKSNTSYYCYISTSNSAIWVFFYNDNALIEGYSTGKERYQNACRIDNTIFTTPSNCNKIKFYVTGEGNSYANDISINYPSTDHDYHAYAGKTYTIQLGDTIYGGELDVVTGELTVTKQSKIFTSADETQWNQFGSSSIFYTAWIKDGKTPVNMGVTGSVSSQYKAVNKRPTDLSNGEFVTNAAEISGAYNSIGVCDSRFSSASDFKASLTTPLEVVYELAEPFTIDLTPQQIKLLENTNTIYTDYEGDTITIEYQPNNAIGDVLGEVNDIYDAIIDDIYNKIESLDTRVTALEES